MILTLDLTNQTHLVYLEDFAKRSRVPFFRYFESRTVEDAIKTHKLTLLEMDDMTVRGYAHIDWNTQLHKFFFAICILPDYQHHGLGTNIIKHLLLYADAHNIDLYLSVDKDNSIAQKLYEKHSFVRIEEKVTYYLYERKSQNASGLSPVIELPVSIGEAIDKLTILDIKLEKIQNQIKRLDCQKEYAALDSKLQNYTRHYHYWYTVLKAINSEIWRLQDILRVTDDKNDLAKYVLDLNDIRFRVKNKINMWASSLYKEQKGYNTKTILLDYPLTMEDAFHNISILKYLSIEYDSVYIFSDVIPKGSFLEPNILIINKEDLEGLNGFATIYSNRFSDKSIVDLKLCNEVIPSLIPKISFIRKNMSLQEAIRNKEFLDAFSERFDQVFLNVQKDEYKQIKEFLSNNYKLQVLPSGTADFSNVTYNYVDSIPA